MPLRAYPKVAVCGLGRLGAQLAYWFDALSVPVVALSSRDLAKATVLASALNHPPRVYASMADAVRSADVTFLALPDDILPRAVEELSVHDLAGRTIVHCFGALPASALGRLSARGAKVAVFHPLQSFGPLDVEGSNVFAGVTVSIDADDETYAVLVSLAEALLACPQLLRLNDRVRAQYHASAVLASNALLVLLDAAIRLLEEAGLTPEEAKRALLPLVRGTIANLDNMSPGQALTGPVSRGDSSTVRKHLEALSNMPELGIYRDMLGYTIELAFTAGRIDDAKVAELRKLLEDRL